MAGAQAVLEELIDTPPRDYFVRVGSQTRLRSLHASCVAAGLVPSSPVADDVARLHALFTLSLERGFGSLVADYLAEVG